MDPIHENIHPQSVTDAITVLTAMPRIVSVLGFNFSLGLSARDRLHKRCRLAALDFQGCLDTGILTKDRADTILSKMNVVIEGQKKLDECKGFIRRKNRAILKGFEDEVRELELHTRSASTERFLRQSMGQTNYQAEDAISAHIKLEAAARRVGIDPVLFTESIHAMFKDYIEKNDLSRPTPVINHNTGPVTIVQCNCHQATTSDSEEARSSLEKMRTPQNSPVDEATGPNSTKAAAAISRNSEIDGLAENYVSAMLCTPSQS